MLMFTAGMHIPVREPELVRRLGRGALAAAAAGVLAIGAGIATARIVGVPHPAIYVVILASGSAAVLVPSLHEAGLLNQSEGLVVAAQIAVADVVAIVAVPLVLQPNRATHALLGALAVAACAVLLYFAIRSLHGAAWIGRIRALSKKREWALDLRLSLLVLFGLAWLATRTGTSVLVAGFAVGLVVAAIGGPKRLSRQVVGVAQGFFVPLFFVVLGAQIDLRAFGTHGSLVELAALLIVFNVAAERRRRRGDEAVGRRRARRGGLARRACGRRGARPPAACDLGRNRRGDHGRGAREHRRQRRRRGDAAPPARPARYAVRRRSVAAASARASAIEPSVTATSRTNRAP